MFEPPKNINNTDDDNKVVIDTVKEFLIEEYKELNNTLHINEERGEKRLEFFVTLSSVVIGAIGFVIKELYENVSDEILKSFYLVLIFLLTALVLIGFIIIRRLKKRNQITDGIINDIKEIRKLVKNNLDTDHKILPCNYSAFENRDNNSEKPKRIFTSIHDITKIITAALIGTAVTFIGLILSVDFFWAVITSTASFFAALGILLFQKENNTIEHKKLTHAGGIVSKKENEKKLFLVITSSTDKSVWVLPKGHIEENETPQFTAIREVLEETGFLAKPTKEVGQVCFTKKNEEVNVAYFLMEFPKNFGTIAEGRNIKWLEKEDAVERLSFDDAKDILKKIF
jgi:8-oxo-dGTP pyrophosphatase MutT (NUDIX family)